MSPLPNGSNIGSQRFSSTNFLIDGVSARNNLTSGDLGSGPYTGWMETKFFSVNANRPGDRILKLVQELSAEICDGSGHKYRIVELLTQKDIAHLTGTTRQTVATVLRKQMKTSQ